MGFNNTKQTSLLKANSVSCCCLSTTTTTTTTTTSSSSIISTGRTAKLKKQTRTSSSTSILYMTKTFVSFSIFLTTLLMLHVHVVDAKIGNYYCVSLFFRVYFLSFIFVFFFLEIKCVCFSYICVTGVYFIIII